MMKKQTQSKSIRVSVRYPNGRRFVKMCSNARVASHYVAAFMDGWPDGSSECVVTIWHTSKNRRELVSRLAAQQLGHTSIRKKDRA